MPRLRQTTEKRRVEPRAALPEADRLVVAAAVVEQVAQVIGRAGVLGIRAHARLRGWRCPPGAPGSSSRARSAAARCELLPRSLACRRACSSSQPRRVVNQRPCAPALVGQRGSAPSAGLAAGRPPARPGLQQSRSPRRRSPARAKSCARSRRGLQVAGQRSPRKLARPPVERVEGQRFAQHRLRLGRVGRAAAAR